LIPANLLIAGVAKNSSLEPLESGGGEQGGSPKRGFWSRKKSSNRKPKTSPDNPPVNLSNPSEILDDGAMEMQPISGAASKKALAASSQPHTASPKATAVSAEAFPQTHTASPKAAAASEEGSQQPRATPTSAPALSISPPEVEATSSEQSLSVKASSTDLGPKSWMAAGEKLSQPSPEAVPKPHGEIDLMAPPPGAEATSSLGTNPSTPASVFHSAEVAAGLLPAEGATEPLAAAGVGPGVEDLKRKGTSTREEIAPRILRVAAESGRNSLAAASQAAIGMGFRMYSGTLM
jgi:hypothetical protein